MRRSLVMFFPAWSVVAATWDESLPDVVPGAAVAVLDKTRISALSDWAAAAGVQMGMKRREAHGVCPGIIFVPHNPLRDSAVFEHVVMWMSRQVPIHAVLEPGLLGFQARGVARFYGGEDAAAQFLLDTALSHTPPIEARVGVANDLFSAVVAARHSTPQQPIVIVPPGGSPEFLAAQPITLLEDERIVSLLVRLGITTVGGFVALGQRAIAERFGTPGECLYLRAIGSDHSRLALTRPPVDPTQRIDLPEPYTLVDQVAFGIRRDTELYYERLLAEGVVCTRVQINIGFDNGGNQHRTWIHPRFFSPTELVDRVRWQLEQCLRGNFTTEHYSPGVISVEYRALEPEEHGAHEPGLWGSGPDARVHQVFSRVQGLVGAKGVLMAHTQISRLATDSQVFTAWGDKPVASKPAGPLPGALPRPLPSTVFRTPKTISLFDSQHHNIVVSAAALSADPAWMSWRGRQIAVSSWAGPWPVSEKWWDPQHSRFVYRLQVLDERGMGWLLIAENGSNWRLEARYD